MNKLLKYDEFILEEEINIDIEQIVKNIKNYLDKISSDLNKINDYFNQVMEYVYKLPRKIRISILVLVIPIFSIYLSNNTIFNQVNLEDRVSIEKEINLTPQNTKLTLSQNGWDFIKDHEKLKLKAYNLGDGKITVGWGHAEDIDKSKYKVGDEISRSEAQKLIQVDMKSAADGIRRILNEWERKGINIQLNQNQFDALVSLAFNCGVQSIRNSDFIQEIKKGNFKNASKLIRSFNLNDKYHGLKNRRRIEED